MEAATEPTELLATPIVPAKRKTKQFEKERDVKAEVKHLLDHYGWYWWMPPANGFGKTGISDFNALKNGVFMAIETKFGKNEPTAMQKGFLSSVAACQSFAFVVTEKNLGYLAAFLLAFERAAWCESQKKQTAPEDGAMMLNAIKALTQGY